MSEKNDKQSEKKNEKINEKNEKMNEIKYEKKKNKGVPEEKQPLTCCISFAVL